MKEYEKIVILGSGKSFLDLSKQELDYIRNCKIRIGLNKYFAFYKKFNILPTHVYMVDVHGNCLGWVEHFLAICKNDHLLGINFIFDNSLSEKFFKNRFQFYRKSINKILSNNEKTGGRLNNVFRKSKRIAKAIFFGQKYLGKYFKIPFGCKVEFVKRSGFLDAKEWAKSFDDELFHFRTSFTSLLNYISIKYPNYPILLVATDFNTGEYFFQKELEMLQIEWTDFTSDISKEKEIHFSIQDYRNTNLLDKMPYIIEKLEDCGNKISCINPNSVLVEKGFVNYSSINIV